MTDRLFSLDDVPEVPLFRPPRRSRGETDARFRNDYPPDWDHCQTCGGRGWLVNGGAPWYPKLDREQLAEGLVATDCPDCLGMGSLKARVRLEAGHRCERCKHPYIPKADARMLGVEPSWRDGGWSPCDDECYHGYPVRIWTTEGWVEATPPPVEDFAAVSAMVYAAGRAEAQWRVLTVHHLDGDKANSAWWNLAALCQRCHLEIQAKVVMERVYPHEHSAWMRPHAAGYYAKVYEDRDITREEAEERMEELLAYERVA